MPRLRSPSLLWTFSGSFFLVLVVAVIVHTAVALAVLGPATHRWRKDRAALFLRNAAADLEALPAPVQDDAVLRVLRARRRELRPMLLVFRDPGGRVLLERRGFGGEREPFPGGAGRERRRPPPEAGPGGAGTSFPPPRLRVVDRLDVNAPNGLRGELIVLAPRPRLAFWPLLPSGAPVVFLPFAVLVAGAGGFVLFRVVVRRLRSLETLADRVTSGDLEARIEDGGKDEIGRLADRLNRMTEQLGVERRAVEAGDAQRRRLLADISHELGTPLTSVRGYAETLLDPNVAVSDEERTQYLRHILEEAKRLDFLIQDVFELTRLESETLPSSRERLDLAALCRHAAARFEPRFRQAGLTLNAAAVLPEAPVTADGRRLEQVVTNLLANALRYVPAGGRVDVGLARAGGGGGPRFLLTVTDDGPGIPPADLPHVFDRFYRADAARTEGGSGLGLAIVQEIVRQHGGSVRAENLSPHGARFTVEFPES